MAWVKLDDAMPHHPKVMAAGPQGFALDVAGLCYANKHMTDGMILEGALPAVLPNLSNPKRWAQRLVEVGRWERIDGGWRIRGYDEYQPSKAEQRAKQQSLSDRGVLGNHRRWHVDNPSPDCPYCDRRSDSDGNPPTRPVPNPNASAASNGFTTFNLKRAEAEVEKRQSKGLPVKSAGGLKRTIADDPEFVEESERIWGHRDCDDCDGKGFLEDYAPGAGMRRVKCTS